MNVRAPQPGKGLYDKELFGSPAPSSCTTGTIKKPKQNASICKLHDQLAQGWRQGEKHARNRSTLSSPNKDQQQRAPHRTHFIAVNKSILACSSISELADLVQQRSLNEVRNNEHLGTECASSCAQRLIPCE
jgi:hypothetical protein